MRIIFPAVKAVDYRTSGSGFSNIHSASRVGGNGFLVDPPHDSQAMYYLRGIAGNTALDSSTVADWTMESAGLSIPWSQPFAYTVFLVLLRALAPSSAVVPGMIGGVSNYNAALPFNQWRTDTSRKRVGINVERDGGVVTWFLSWANGVTRNELVIPAIADQSWISIVYQPSPKSATVYVNGGLWATTVDGSLPDGAQTDRIFFSLGVAKELTGAEESSVRLWAPAFVSSRVLAR